MNQAEPSKKLDFIYDASLLIKGVSAVIEVIAGMLTFFITQQFVINIASWLTQGELSEDPAILFPIIF